MHRRKLLAGLAATATAPFLGSGSAQAGEALLGELLVARLRDAMLGLGAATAVPSSEALSTDFTHALADFDACRYASLAVRLPRLIRAGHAPSTGSHDTEQSALLAKSYLLATRMLVKMDEQELGWMAVDRARQLAEAAGDVLAVAESARQVAVLARRAGWHDQALSIAVSAADNPDLRGIGRAGTAVRGLLVQSASYTLARRGDRDGMRELTGEAAALAKELGGATMLRDHGGGYASPILASPAPQTISPLCATGVFICVTTRSSASATTPNARMPSPPLTLTGRWPQPLTRVAGPVVGRGGQRRVTRVTGGPPGQRCRHRGAARRGAWRGSGCGWTCCAGSGGSRRSGATPVHFGRR